MKLSINNLSKTYDNGVKAIQNVSLDLEPGLFGLLGPNGAGKTTLMRTLATLQAPDTGAVRLGEWDLLHQPMPVRQVLGYLPQEFGVYPGISAYDLLHHFAVLKGIPKRECKPVVENLLALTNLYQARKQAVSQFSGGMLRRWGIAQALLGDPAMIIVDEPTAGLDPVERARFHNLLCDIGDDVIVILSTHLVNDVADLCSNLAIMAQGRLLLRGNPWELTSRLTGAVWSKPIHKSEMDTYRDRYEVLSSRLGKGRTQVRIYSLEDPGNGFTVCTPELEDVYFGTVAGYLTAEVSL